MVVKDRVTLSCGHNTYFREPVPLYGEIVLCPKCSDYKTVMSSVNEQFRMKCNDCTASRRYGEDQSEAERAASRHAIRYASHTVGVYKGKELLHEVGAKGDTLPFEVQVRHRTEASQDHQRSLRDFQIRATTVINSLP